MKLIGRVSNGVIVLPSDAHLAEGDEVEVRPLAAIKSGRELADVWSEDARLPVGEAESFASDIEKGRARLNRPPASPAWE